LNDAQFIILLEGCRNQNRKSQENLYKNLYGYAMNISLRYSKDNEEATEVVNDAFMKIFRDILKFSVPEKLVYPVFKSWIKKITIYTAIDYFRANEKHKYHEDINDYSQSHNYENNVLNDLSYENLIKIIQQLSPAYKTVFNLFVIDGFTHEEIAKKLGVSEGTSKSNL